MTFVRGLFVAIVVATCGARAEAHPLGNFTSNHLTRITVSRDAVLLHYVLDDAEIPTFSLLRSLQADGRPTRETIDRWAAAHAAEIAPDLQLSIDGSPAALRVLAHAARLRPGAAGLSTLYFTADYRATRPPSAQRIEYTDATLLGHIGWKDVVVAPAREPTDELRAYPNALIGSPRDRTSIAVDVARGTLHVEDTTEAPALGTVSVDRMNDLSDVLARNLSDPVVLAVALLVAVALGALHALEPGHGKTLLAVSLVGARATLPQAALLAGSLTVAHTIGVLAFGAIVLVLARSVMPETLYPWIALLSGVLVALLGAQALTRELRRRGVLGASPRRRARAAPVAHVLAAQAALAAYAHEHDHAHADLDDEAHARAHAIPGAAPLSFREALVAAASGNIAPCPAALVVLLAAIATHRVGYGLVLIVAFSVGLALTLTALGFAVVRSAAWLTKRPQFDRLSGFAPLVTAVAISLIGACMVSQGIVAQGVAVAPAAVTALVVAAIAAYVVLRSSLPRFKETLST